MKDSTMTSVGTRYKSTRMEQRQEGSQGERWDKIDHFIPLTPVQSQTPQSLPEQPTRSRESEVTKQNQQSTKELQVITAMKNSSDGEKSPEDTMLLQNKPISAHRSILKTNEEDYEGKESAREDPTIDEYQDMKGKKEDDNGKSKSTNESMRVNHFADLLVHVELEQLSNCSRFQSKPVKETGRA